MSRNAHCPCGSGRRYKDCHGAIAAREAPAHALPATAPGHSAYRPAGPDWEHLSTQERDVCGLLMQRALKQQLAGRLAEAAANYAQVLSHAPNTHDALHMLGAIEMRRGNFAEAKKLIRAALILRAPYPDIEHNLRMVEDFERAERVGAGRRSEAPEALCERALPALVDLALRPARTGTASRHVASRELAGPIHLIAGVRDSNDDAGWLLRRLAALFAASRPMLWDGANARSFESDPQRVRRNADWPEGGCHIFVGVDVDDRWIARGDAERVIVFCQPAPPSQLLDRLRAISRDGACTAKLIFPSAAMAARFGSGHAVLPPPIATEYDFSSAERSRPSAPRPFTVGLIGRHFQGTSPNEDAEFLRRLGATATLEVYDPGPLRYVIGGNAAVRCRTRSATAMHEFLRSVDCLLHPGGKWWLEGDGRELFMTMAAGVPVVCPHSSIFAEYIRHGGDGLLYDTPDSALGHVAALRNPALCAELGRAASSNIAQLVAPERVMSSLRRLVFGEVASLAATGGGAAREPMLAK